MLSGLAWTSRDTVNPKYNEKVFVRQFPIVKWFIYHLICYRQVKSCEDDFKSTFWAFTGDAHLRAATIYWCMVFGSHTNNPTHWKNLVRDEGDLPELRAGFRKAVLSQTGFTDDQWDEYWQKIVDFRNRYVAHLDLGGFKDVVPLFDKAMDVAFAYDDWIRDLYPGIWQERPLKVSVEKAKEDFLVFRKHFMKSG